MCSCYETWGELLLWWQLKNYKIMNVNFTNDNIFDMINV